LIIAGIAFGALVVIILVAALFKRKTPYGSSRFIDEERRSQHRSFTPLASQELTKDIGANDTDFM
jgi:hypothetical protein